MHALASAKLTGAVHFKGEFDEVVFYVIS
jgi:hypothetical protein